MQPFLIAARDAVLDFFSGASRSPVLNPPSPNTPNALPDPLFPAREIAKAVNEFKTLAMDTTGAHVDYPALAGSDIYQYFREQCTPLLARFNPLELKTKESRLAFWINLYNALVIDAVIRYGIQKSVTERRRGGLISFFRRAAYSVGGRRISLDDIEHGVLRSNSGHPFLPGPQFGPQDPRRAWVLVSLEPRIHFALNCASVSCPPVGVYDPRRIDAQLDLAAGSFIDSEVTIMLEEKTLVVSKIFQWYASDFGGTQGILKTIGRYLPKGQHKSWLAANLDSARLRYADYDWGLNR